MSNDFGKWFDAQFGKRPNRLSVEQLARAEASTKQAAVNATNDYESVLEWEHKRNVALLAWNARVDAPR